MTTQKDQKPFCQKIQQRASGPGESSAGDMYLLEYTQKVAASSKSCGNVT